jgi:hypothetical protein
VQVKVRVEGRGNVQLIKPPPLGAPAGLRTYDPETKDTSEPRGSTLTGARVVEYTLVPQQTGTFVLPPLQLDFYDPAAKAWQRASVDAVSLTVTPAGNGATALAEPGGASAAGDEPKNTLVNGGLKALRHTARFEPSSRALWSRPWFVPLAVAPVALTLLAALLVLGLGAAVKETPESRRKQQAKAARKRLAAADKLARGGSTVDFYAEVERALFGFLESHLGDLKGLTRPELIARLAAAGVPEEERGRVARVLETCDMGRYAPGMGEASARARAVEDAAAAMEHWS